MGTGCISNTEGYDARRIEKSNNFRDISNVNFSSFDQPRNAEAISSNLFARTSVSGNTLKWRTGSR